MISILGAKPFRQPESTVCALWLFFVRPSPTFPFPPNKSEHPEQAERTKCKLLICVQFWHDPCMTCQRLFDSRSVRVVGYNSVLERVRFIKWLFYYYSDIADTEK